MYIFNGMKLTQKPYRPFLMKMFLTRPYFSKNRSMSRSRTSWGKFPKNTLHPSLDGITSLPVKNEFGDYLTEGKLYTEGYIKNNFNEVTLIKKLMTL